MRFSNPRADSDVISTRKSGSTADINALAENTEMSESQASREVDASQHSVERAESTSWAPTASSSNLREQPSTASRSLPATPPPDFDFEVKRQLIDGVGRYFTATLPSRAESLTIESQSATETWATHPGTAETPGSSETGCVFVLKGEAVDTPRMGSPCHGTPTWSFLFEDLFGHVYPLTPGLIPDRKRTLSPPSAPPPAKRAKTQAQRAYEDSENELHPEDSRPWDKRTPRHWHARQLTIGLVGTAANSVASLEAGQEGFNRAMVQLTRCLGLVSTVRLIKPRIVSLGVSCR
ncbi:hypothetical protein C8A03DRAFT_12886 [Achaetomium macrosporum]|uniref:Uncharacterized protein n=1 Tax=Achaetomium macrosporum TaxID=79813 RepID=A0AAN7CF19_9PEZI|nr:hypothetical protein C8A03DRAFT_12886 [Achaetomium macrosporum]